MPVEVGVTNRFDDPPFRRRGGVKSRPLARMVQEGRRAPLYPYFFSASVQRPLISSK